MADILQEIATNLYNGNAPATKELVQKALDQGLGVGEVLNGGLVAGMDQVGKDFKAGELFVPEVLIAARAMNAGMELLKPLLADSDVPSAGKFAVGTVKGDLHDIGKNLVRMMVEGGGFEVLDLGVDVSPEAFVKVVREQKPDVIGLSALLTTTMTSMKDIIEALQEAGLRDSVKVMIGGAPVTEAYAKEIGADGYAPDAASAVDVARALVG
ncbi:MAG: cobalamin-binding protein [Anaerolineales bacterium]|nr:cobalamin-binding protein [Anaerolineales bacterium]